MVGVAALVAAACGSAEPPAVMESVETTPAEQATDPPASAETAGSPDDVGLQIRFGDLTARTIDIEADGRNATAAIESLNRFAVDIYASVAADEESNFIIGPYSISFALSMIYAGASGVTAEEIAAVLHADGVPDWHEGLNAYDLSLDARTVGSPTEWRSANQTWSAPDLVLLDEYLDVLTGAYGAPMVSVNFAEDPERARAAINEWTESETNGLIDELFPAGSIKGNTRLALVNAVALDAPWEFPFDPARTGVGDFTTIDGSVVRTPMMRYDEFLPSYYGEGFSAVELPYGGGALSMVAMVPYDDFTSFEAGLDAERLNAVFDGLSEGGIHLLMPRWTSRTALSLPDTLSELGMPSAFGADADFRGMTGGRALWLDAVEHQAFIEVDENGTRAAAATGGAMADSHGPSVYLDRPFVYVIRDRNAGTVLFIGRVLDPTQPE